MQIKNWKAIIDGSEAYPALMDFSRLDDKKRELFASKLEARGVAILKRPKKPGEVLDPDVLAYEEAHRAFSGWKKQIGDAMGRRVGFRRYTSAGYVKKLQKWTADMLRMGIKPGEYLQAATEMLSRSPTFNPSVSFSPNYLFCDGVLDSTTDRIASNGRILNPAQAGRSDKNSFVGNVDARVLEFLASIPGFDTSEWQGSKLNSIVVAAKRLAAKGRPFIPANVKRFAVPLSQQDWIKEA